jgi:hypothetical protein
VLHLLGGADQRGVQHRAALELVHQLLAFLDQALHRLAGLALGLDAELAGGLLQPLHLALRLLAVLLEGLLQALGAGGLCHRGQRLQDLGLGAVGVLQHGLEQLLGVCGHDVLRTGLGSRGNGRAVGGVAPAARNVPGGGLDAPGLAR